MPPLSADMIAHVPELFLCMNISIFMHYVFLLHVIIVVVVVAVVVAAAAAAAAAAAVAVAVVVVVFISEFSPKQLTLWICPPEYTFWTLHVSSLLCSLPTKLQHIFEERTSLHFWKECCEYGVRRLQLPKHWDHKLESQTWHGAYALVCVYVCVCLCGLLFCVGTGLVMN